MREEENLKQQEGSGVRYNRNDIVKMVAEKAGFTRNDVSLIFYALRDVLIEILAQKGSVSFRELFHIGVSRIKGRNMLNPYTQTYQDFPEVYTIHITPGRFLHRKINQLLKDK